MKIFNTLTMRKEEFNPPKPARINFFVCGPTVYDYSHLGHARTYVAFDMIARYLKRSGYDVFLLVNITDVAEKIAQRAGEIGKRPPELASEFENEFLRDMHALRVSSVSAYARASDYIPEIIQQVQGLVSKSFAYETPTGVYFNARKAPWYGELSHQTRGELQLRRLELCSSKKHHEDFSLWRKLDEDGYTWDSPWGTGRPGWHVEDTAISMKFFGQSYDLHGGARELVFPHHDAEIAQAEAFTGVRPFVRIWLHSGLLNFEGEKMSKSLGNVIRITDSVEKFGVDALRLLILSRHYRQSFDLTWASLRNARRSSELLRSAISSLQEQASTSGSSAPARLLRSTANAMAEFHRNMQNDFDTPKVISQASQLARMLLRYRTKLDEETKRAALQYFAEVSAVTGIFEDELRGNGLR